MLCPIFPKPEGSFALVLPKNQKFSKSARSLRSSSYHREKWHDIGLDTENPSSFPAVGAENFKGLKEFDFFFLFALIQSEYKTNRTKEKIFEE